MMGSAGIRRIHLSLVTAGELNPVVARRLLLLAADRIKRRGWHVQIYTKLAVISGVKNAVRDSPTPVVHGGVRVAWSGTFVYGTGSMVNRLAVF
jgi:hypothetical protein